ncbi:MAG: MBG domain-containing protein [Aquidulcibacter sp.]
MLKHHSRLLHVLLASTALVGVDMALARAQTLPTGASVAAGQVSIATPQAGRMAINQGSQSAIVNWQAFSIGQGGRVDIQQPNASAVMLNRVTGSATSSIAGQLNANGQVILVNPNGIAITGTGTVNTGSFVASTLGISDNDFLSGRRSFQGNGASATVSNAGSIQVAQGGHVALLGGRVDNSGTISVPMGRVGLASGERATLDLTGDGFLQVTLPTAAGGDAPLVNHSGRISAPGGRVEIAAATARSAVRNAINIPGSVDATAVSGRPGAIVFSGGEGGNVAISGRVDASSATGRGGNVTVTGANIALRGAEVNASGATGGGRVRIGGDRLGNGPLQRANQLSVDQASVISADAAVRGNGGDVVLWSEIRTDFAGRISARGGVQGGNGGEAEVSSRGVLNYTGLTDLRAPLGTWGTLLLDPYNITISDGTQTTDAGFTPNTDNSVINVDTLVTALGTANVVVSTGLAGSAGTQDGNITLSVPLTWSSASNLTLEAAGGITLNGAVSAVAGGLKLQAGGTIGATGAISVARFELLGGNWVQNSATLPGFVTTDFRITGGSFLRAAGGDGSTATPFLLTDIYGVQGMGSSSTLLGNSYQLANDIAASGTSGWNGGAGFVPVGTDAAPFYGSLNGAGYVINGLTINRPSMSYVGLIGYAGSGSSISNLGLVGGSVTGLDQTGGLVGENLGSITQSYATGAVTGDDRVGGLVGRNDGSITQSYATGAVTSNDDRVGGLVGWNLGSITQSYATGAVTGDDRVGGLVGFNEGTITQSYATGAVNGDLSVGGLVGVNSIAGTITQAYATGLVTGSGVDVGGLVRLNDGGSITQSYWDTQTTGQETSAGGTGLNTAQARSQASYTGWNFGNDGVWYQAGDMRPMLRSEAATAVNGVITIRNLNQLQLMGANLAGSYRLAGNIDASATDVSANSPSPGIWSSNGFVPVGLNTASFTGSLNGAGYAITGLTINRPTTDYVGLIGYAGLGSSISNLGLVGGSVTGRFYVGGLVGYNFRGSITQSYTTGAVKGGNFVGGLAGYNFFGTITQAYATGAVTSSGDYAGSGEFAGGLVASNQGTITRSYATGAVTGLIYVGGLVGINANTIEQSYATGAVKGTTFVGGLVGFNDESSITQSYATGAVTGTVSVGGLVGANPYEGPITQSYWDMQSTGRTTSAGGTGLTTAQARSQAGYTGWNFGNSSGVWYQAGDMRPILRSEAATAVDGVITIRNLNQLQLMNINLTGQYRLAGNIDASATDVSANSPSPGIWSSNGFVPVGTSAERFTGSLNGAGYVINGLRINRPTLDYVGLIGYAGSGSSISNLGLVGGSVTGRYQVGGLVGENKGSITQSYATGAVTSNIDSVGGLVGVNSGSITQSYATGAVNGTSFLGGLVGYSNGTITQSYATGAVMGSSNQVGGLVGGNRGTITQSYATGAVTGSSNQVGGLVGGNFGTITQSYWDTQTTGRTTSDGGTGLTTAQMQDITSFSTNYAGWDFNSVWAPPNQANQYGNATANYPQLYAVTPVMAVIAKGASWEYGDTPQSGGSSATYNGLRAGDLVRTVATLSTVDGWTVGSGAAISNPSGLSYRIVYAPARGGETPRLITVTPNAGQSREYGDANPVLGYTLSRTTAGATGGALVGSDSETGAIDTLATQSSGVGNYDFTIGSLSAGSNYTFTIASAPKFSVTPRLVTVTPSSGQSREYGDANPTLGYALSRTTMGASGGAMVGSDALTGTLQTLADATSGVSSYAIIQGTLAASSNYTLAFTSGQTMAVTRRLVTVTPNAGQSREYGDTNPTLGYALSRTTAGATGGALVGSDSATGAIGTLATESSGVGNYDFTIGSLSAGSNYTFTIASAPQFSVTPRLVTVTPNSGQSREYGDANPTLGYALSRTTMGASGGAMVGSDALTGTLQTLADATSGVSSYAIIQGTLAASSNYTLAFTSGQTMAVTRRLVTVTPNAGQSREYGDTNPTLTYTLSRTTTGASGGALANSDALTGALATPATVLSAVSNYAINQGDLALSANYTMTFTTGRTLAVTPRLITVTAVDQRMLAGLAVPDLTYTIGGRGLANQDQITGALVTEGSSSSVPGQYQILQGSISVGDNYRLTYVPGVLTIDPNATNVTATWASTVSGIVMDRSNSLSNAPLPMAGLPPSNPAQTLTTQIANISSPLVGLVFDNALLTQGERGAQ